MKTSTSMSTPTELPFELSSMSSGYAELTRSIAALGVEAAAAVGSSLQQLLGCEVRLSGRALPSPTLSGGEGSRLSFDLPALPGTALWDVDSTLIARIVDRLAGGTGACPGATRLTPIEESMLELMALVALDAISRLEPIERLLSPRLCRVCPRPVAPLCVAVEISVGLERGRGRLWLPSRAIRALRERAELPKHVAEARVEGSIREGSVVVTAAELSDLAIGDVLLLDPDPVPTLFLPGGARLSGRIAEHSFHVERPA